MRKQVFGRRFKRDRNERKALFKSLISAMVLKGKIQTTEEKAKAIKGDLEKLVTKAKKGESARRFLTPYLRPFEIEKMINQIALTFKERNGGYTRIIKTGRRFSDNASMVIMQWVETIQIKNEKLNIKNEKTKESKTTSPIKKTANRKSSSSGRAARNKSSVAKAKEDK